LFLHCAISSADCFGRIRETPTFTTLLTGFVPSFMITKPSVRRSLRLHELAVAGRRLEIHESLGRLAPSNFIETD